MQRTVDLFEQERKQVSISIPSPSRSKKKHYRFLCPRCWEVGWLGGGRILNARKHGYHANYIRHYSADKYRNQMIRYRNHEIKSRPNGQKRCYVPNTDWETVNPDGNGRAEYLVTCCFIEGGKAKLDHAYIH